MEDHAQRPPQDIDVATAPVSDAEYRAPFTQRELAMIEKAVATVNLGLYFNQRLVQAINEAFIAVGGRTKDQP